MMMVTVMTADHLKGTCKGSAAPNAMKQTTAWEAKNDVALAAVGFAYIILMAWFFQQVFSARGAFIHTGALMATRPWPCTTWPSRTIDPV